MAHLSHTIRGAEPPLSAVATGKSEAALRRSLLQASCSIERVSPADWRHIRRGINEAEQTSIPGEGAYPNDFLKALFKRENSINLVQRDTRDSKIVGYCSAVNPNERYFNYVDLIDYGPGVRYLFSIAIHGSYQGNGLVWKLIQRLEEEMRKEGSTILTGNFADFNGFADSVRKHYGKRVLRCLDAESEWGKQKYLMIDIDPRLSA